MGNYNLCEMSGLDIFLQSLSEGDRKKYMMEIESNRQTFPLKSWNLSSEFFKPTDLLNARQKDYEKLIRLGKQFDWKTDLTDILSKPYEALVLTDHSQNIIWTNPGFFKMTGYSESYAVGKRPTFLQGSKTSSETKLSIKQKLHLGEPFKEKILNYKKDRTEYLCQVQIFPIYSKKRQTHYLALETELI